METVTGIFSSAKMLFELQTNRRAFMQESHTSLIIQGCNFCVVFCSISVKEAGRDFTYFIVVLVGIGVTGYFLKLHSLSGDTFH